MYLRAWWSLTYTSYSSSNASKPIHKSPFRIQGWSQASCLDNPTLWMRYVERGLMNFSVHITQWFISNHGLKIQQSCKCHLMLVEPTPAKGDASVSSSGSEDGKCGALRWWIPAYKRSILKWIKCDSCDEYFHDYCVGLNKTPANDYCFPVCV